LEAVRWDSYPIIAELAVTYSLNVNKNTCLMITFDVHITKDAIGLAKIVIKVTTVIKAIKVNENFIIIMVEFDIIENFMPITVVAEIIGAVRTDSCVNYLFSYLL
jgi:hypothetical protein